MMGVVRSPRDEYRPDPGPVLAEISPALDGSVENMLGVLNYVDNQNEANLAEARQNYELAVAAARAEYDEHQTQHNRVSGHTEQLRQRLVDDAHGIVERTQQRDDLIEQRQQTEQEVGVADIEQAEADQRLREIGTKLSENTLVSRGLNDQITMNQMKLSAIGNNARHLSADESTETQLQFTNLHDAQASLHKQASDLRAEKNALVAGSAEATMQRSEIEARIVNLNQRLADLSRQINLLESEITALHEDIDIVGQVIDKISVVGGDDPDDDHNMTKTALITIVPVQTEAAEASLADIPSPGGPGVLARAVLDQIKGRVSLEPTTDTSDAKLGAHV